MIVAANGQRAVTVHDLKKAAKSKASCRSILRALHDRNIYFRKLREKPLLTPEDIKARFQFAKTSRSKSAAWWVDRIDAFIDGKHFQVYLHGKERRRAAQHARSGAHRQPGKGLCGGYVKPKALPVHEVAHGRWSGQAAANFYKILARDLAKALPDKRRFAILEDNDPTGFKSAKGIAAKDEVNKRLRKQESKWPNGKKETRIAYHKRLKLAIHSLPEDFLLKSIRDMTRRCHRLYEANGYFFEEGGLD
ncbi:unnamed protein product [Symbiodinium pilosum]|uniref:Transposase Tc1-like domain-containing protein n=1 Tax=Symbiodinium pilosum TaxID=2952 RepID=A0A812LFJ9_SYMPI|nr:unnamed protein product [Symbiodinium pilosum]